MSFILDALRKSEAARRRSEAPDLFAQMPQAQPLPQAPPRWPWWTLGVALAIALSIAVGLLTRRAQAPVAAAPAVENAVESATENAIENAIENGDIAAASQAGAGELATPEAEPVVPSELARNQTPPPAQVVSAPPVAAASPPAFTPIATAPPAPPPAASLPAPSPASAPATAPVATPAPPPTGDRIFSAAELEPALRRELPALKLSMHLWNETPARRFIILDGQRLKEGDVLGEGVSGEIVVERIDRDGAVLAWRGIRLRIE
jgi:general secretion pathway protein B